MKPNIENIPCFKQVAQVIGRTQARIELFKAVGWKKWFEKNQAFEFAVVNVCLIDSFVWSRTPQGLNFWNNIDIGIKPYTGEKVNGQR